MAYIGPGAKSGEANRLGREACELVGLVWPGVVAGETWDASREQTLRLCELVIAMMEAK